MKKIFALLALSLFFGISGWSQISFTASNTQVCLGQSITFTNTSGTGDIYNWNMGDGTSFNNQTNVSHTFTQAGGYWVYMDAYDSFGNYLGFFDLYVEVIGPPDYINNMPDQACPGDEVNMYVYMQDAVSWSWDLGDGTTQTGTDYIEHAYSSPGTYYPEVTITGTCGTFTVQDTIEITNSLPYFGYYTNLWVDPDSVCPGANVNGSTYGGFSGYDWDFGDGNTASGNDYQQWTYGSVGTYTVSLTVSNGCGVDTTVTDDIVVSNTTPVQNPGIDLPDTICPNEGFYADAYSNDGVTYTWDMGDGSPAVNDDYFEHTYTSPGVYTAQVTITNDCGNSVTLSQDVVVSPNAQVINPYLSMNKNIVCPGDLVEFGSNNEYDFYIDYGDGNGSNTEGTHSYNNPGVYIVSSTIQNACGNSATVFDTVTVQNNLPINPGSINAWVYPDPACPGDVIEFNSSYGFSSYYWEFGDGTTASGQEVDKIYNSPGIYNAMVTIENGCGSQATTPVSVDVQGNLPITGASLFIPVDTTCIGNSVFLQSDDGDEGYDYLWDLGDGNTADSWAIAHSYDALGTYYISLTMVNGCGNDTTLMDSIVVSDNYTPDVSDIQAFVQPEGCVGDELVFALIPAGLGDITWDFGDGNSTSQVDQVFVEGVANVDVSTHTYSSPGTYWVSYTLTNACGNSVTDSVEVTIGVPGDNVSLNVDMIIDESQTACQGTPIEFMAIGGGTYIWDFGDGSGQLATYQSLSPVYHTYENAGSYTVTVTGVNACGNSDESEDQIVIPPSKIDVSTNTVTEPNCGMNNGLAVVSASGGIPPYSYEWTNGDVGVIADSLYSGIYVVEVTDINGCSNEGTATVSDEEGVTILVDNVVDVDCYGEDNGSISVSLLGGQPPYEILWSNGDQTEDIYGLQAGPYEIFVTDANGCFAVQTIEVTQPSKSNISILTNPATCGLNNGSASATVNNGTTPYNFIWPNATGPSNSTGGLSPGMHTLLVIDGNTCLLEKDFAINETGAPIIVKDSSVTGTCNGTLSSIYLSTIGGQQPFTYSWSDGSANQDLTDVLPGEYTVEVTGNNGCSAFAGFTVEEGQPSQTNICMVDVDTLTGTNLIVWEPVNDPGIASYNIYKESSEAGLYYLIGNQSATNISQYHDSLSDPTIRSWRYKVAAVDDCGNEAELSDYHKTIHLTANMGISNDVNLIWDEYEGFSYNTYYINRWHPSTGWQIIDSVSSNVQSYTDASLPGDSSLIYMISIPTPQTCTAQKAQDYNSSRSNNGSVNMPVDTDLGVDDMDTAVQLYPNPTNGIVQIRYEGEVSAIRMYDMSGQLIYEESNAFGAIHKIDMSGYERGMYNIQLLTNYGLINAKVIRE